jgi:threonine dehydrogenase-like Zn-dependent dehydrogenase
LTIFESLACAVTWVRPVKEGDVVVVEGPGHMGLATVVAARAAGAGTIIVTGLESDAHKLALAREFGADHTLVVDGEQAENTVERVREITDGAMADVVLELTPMAAGPVTDALHAAKHGGTVVLAGLKGHREIPIVTDLVINRALTIKGAYGVDARANAEAIALIESRRFPLEKMHTHTFGLDDTALAIETLAGEVPAESAVHVSVHPNL